MGRKEDRKAAKKEKIAVTGLCKVQSLLRHLNITQYYIRVRLLRGCDIRLFICNLIRVDK